MRISIVVPAFNEEKLIVRTLRTLKEAGRAFKDKGWESEIVVCDNNSTDQTAALAQSEGARVTFEPLNQISRARNTGAAAATGDWFIFVDADSWPTRGLFQEVSEVIERGDVLAGGSTVRLDESLPMANLIAMGWNCLSRLMRWAAGSFVFCQAEAFRELGGFSLNLYATEELEFSQRLKRLAKVRGKKMRILHRNPILTSARKIHLYSHREHLRFLFRTVLRPGSLRSRDGCPLWYNGKR